MFRKDNFKTAVTITQAEPVLVGAMVKIMTVTYVVKVSNPAIADGVVTALFPNGDVTVALPEE